MTTQQLLEMSERGVYNKAAVKKLLAEQPVFGRRTTDHNEESGAGKTMIDDISTAREDDNYPYEVLRFQGLFTVEDEDTGIKIRKQFWIDIGERNHCLRVMESPVIGGFKTFSFCNYDTMVGEFNSDSVISPYKGLQFEMNDKENQSLDGLTFNLNGPIVVDKASGIDPSAFIKARKKPNLVIEARKIDAIKKMTVEVPLNHLNQELCQFIIEEFCLANLSVSINIWLRI